MSDTPTNPDAPSVPAVSEPAAAQSGGSGRRQALKPIADPTPGKVDLLDWHIGRANDVRQKTSDKHVKVPRYPELVAYLKAEQLDRLSEEDAKFARVHIAAAASMPKGNQVILQVAHYHKLVSLAVELES